jgi:hypothetical protein
MLSLPVQVGDVFFVILSGVEGQKKLPILSLTQKLSKNKTPIMMKLLGFISRYSFGYSKTKKF